MSDQSRAVVVGGGIAGLLAALLLAERHRIPVTLIEREAEIGGLLRCFDYGEHGRFDYGMHNMFETGIPDLDELLWGLLPESEWQVLAGEKRDLAGLFYRGQLQANSLYMDLRSLPKSDRDRCLRGLLAAIPNANSSAPNALEHACGRFGDPIAEMAIAPALTKLFHRSPEDLAVMATQLTAMDRVVLFDEKEMAAVLDDERLRSRIAFPDQRRLPSRFASGRRAFYPRQYGIYRVVEAIRSRLSRAGVEILCGATLKAVCIQEGTVASVEYEKAGLRKSIAPVKMLCWTIGLPALASLLGAMPANLAFDRPMKTVVVNFLLRNPPNMADLYYFYCYESGFDTLRVTNYGAYCEGAVRHGGHPLSVELLEVDDGKLDPERLASKARRELEQFGVLQAQDDVVFSRTEILASGFPMPTVKNVTSMNRIREAVSGIGLKNMLPLGILAERDLFFQRDVLAHVYKSIEGVA